MNLRISGASTLKSFSDSIASGFAQAGARVVQGANCDFELIQVHGAPEARAEDEEIIASTEASMAPKAYLIHRPDEILGNLRVLSHFEKRPSAKIIFLGDLIFRYAFWARRQSVAKVIPHPHLGLSLPPKSEKMIVGSFTSWGEMRSLSHYSLLVEQLKDRDFLEFRIGGRGVGDFAVPSRVQLSKEYFTPHFNVQLYHLLGKKRYGESSGSLHRGISVPVIFEANGAERLEGFKAIKVDADDDLKNINFEKAAAEILALAKNGIDPVLEINKSVAQKNSVGFFARSALAFFAS